jgi:uncharacterized protein YcbK (DUF882 family)
MLPRRHLILAAASALLSGRSAPAAAAGERWLWVVNAAGEEAALAYRVGGEYHPPALQRLRHLFRDLHENVPGPLPPLLIDMLSVLQERWAYTRPLVLNSGYRTPRTNASIEGAAPASLHMQGLAADVTLRGVHPDALGTTAWMLSQRLGFMGVGLYTGFLHLDIGPRRSWTRFVR